MAIGDSSTPNASNPRRPTLSLLTMFRLGLFQMGLGIMSILTLGVLNRVMIKELAIPATIAAGTIAMHQFVAPARLWFGQLSDARPIQGHHRTGYVWLGSILFSLAAFLAVQVMWQLGTSIQSGLTGQASMWTAVLALVFALYGIALSASSTPFAALLVDVSDEDNRSKLVGVVWSMLMVGIVVGAILSSRLLPQPVSCQELGTANLEVLRTGIDRLFLIVPAIVIGLTVLATFGIERKYSRFAERSSLVEREDQITLSRALRVLTASPQTGLFFTFLLFMTISLFMQDAVMESYGGQVFGMCIGETTRLNAFFGTGTLVGIGLSGFAVVPRIGKKQTARLGCLMVAFCLLLIIITGFSGNSKLLQYGLLLFGFASGVTTTGAISLMLDLTAAETAGTFIGAWGLAQALARALATVLGGAVLDVGKLLFTNLTLAYGLVFGLQAVGMVTAVWLLSRVNVAEFRSNTKAAIASVLEAELD
ncbi:BCD family MFS transporter [Leptolyngbya sp. NK1-12]|uniref:BCD family MFS transporter n=1 Tax=Leptolyngbya sp. NK1-12 TaxID=2547451 RepID=A0AA97APS3_9CYAN|nr:BCD family MFS transporter [Leptolyngbya sp. NK1-12]WNZ22143.1 BCD family MFS transporter [Leptolyngbya sp. NK1-12]